MNLDIQNYGHYRVTSHGGRRFDLFNRESDRVFEIDQASYAMIQRSPNPISACASVETALNSGWKK